MRVRGLSCCADSRIRTMCGQIGNTSDSVALNFNIRAEHLPNKRFKSAQLDNQELVVRFTHNNSAPQKTRKKLVKDKYTPNLTPDGIRQEDEVVNFQDRTF